MSLSIFQNFPLREQDLSRKAIFTFRFSSLLFVITAVILVVFDMILGLEMTQPLKLSLQGMLLVSTVLFNLNRLSMRVAFPVKTLDEWEIKFKADAEMIAYRMISAVTMIGAIAALAIYEFWPGFTLSAEQLVGIAVLWMILVFVVPLAILAWWITPLEE